MISEEYNSIKLATMPDLDMLDEEMASMVLKDLYYIYMSLGDDVGVRVLSVKYQALDAAQNIMVDL